MAVFAAPDQDQIWRELLIPDPSGCGCTFSVSPLNFAMAALATAGDGALATLVPLQLTPATHYPIVFVNGQQQILGGLAADCYFSGDGGVTARTLGPGGTLAAGDRLYWNGTVAGFELAGTDVITFDYFEAS